MHTGFDPYARDYSSLSVRDLLDARDAYHMHLCHLENVFATGVGRYLIRRRDPDNKRYVPPARRQNRRAPHHARRGSARAYAPRTLENSDVRHWSWPCVLVFVTAWESPDDLHQRGAQVVPPFLYLPDGRVVPTCVVQASLYDGPEEALGPLRFSSHVLGGGYPVLTEVQGTEHVGSIGCLVTDGRRLFAMTSQHVTGDAGTPVYTLVSGNRHQIGTASPASRRKAPFERMYPGLAGSHTMTNLDVGLIDVADAAQWTAQIFGVGKLGALLTFDASTASLDWIGTKVAAHGAASGELKGEIRALFYRYRTIGGTDYVCDFLIGGRDNKPLPTRPGDSGTIWCVDATMLAAESKTAARNTTRATGAHAAVERYRPLAIQWGGEKLSAAAGEKYVQFALATSLSVACRELDVDLVVDTALEMPQYWGAIGHYTIAALALEHVNKNLAAFLRPNLARLTYDAKTLATGKVSHDASQFIPLADVPDIVWKTTMNRGSPAARPQENWNHYADIDLPGSDGRTLSDICGTAPVVLDATQWVHFYQTAPKPSADRGTSRTVEMGSLPFRIWQIFDAMTKCTSKKDQASFLCAAGVLAHYVGDACQPLHGSMHSDGLNGARTGVHSVFEEKMVDVYASELQTKIDGVDWAQLGAEPTDLKTGYDAGVASLELMRRCAQRLPPAHICEVYTQLGGGTASPVIAGMWQQLAPATAECIADGARTLAAIWDAAFEAAGSAFSGEVTQKDLMKLYDDPKFVPSMHLAHYDPTQYAPPNGVAPPPAEPAKPATKRPARRKRAVSKTARRKRAGARKPASR